MLVRIATALIVILIPQSQISPPGPDYSAAQQARINAAIATFTAQGLELPKLEIRFSDDESNCRGRGGLFEPKYSPWRISICAVEDYVMVHELAHAWVESNLHHQEKTAYLSRKGLPSWNDPSHSWNERGGEHAAFIVQTNLSTQTARNSRAWRSRVADYEFLTSKRSPLRLT